MFGLFVFRILDFVAWQLQGLTLLLPPINFLKILTL